MNLNNLRNLKQILITENTFASKTHDIYKKKEDEEDFTIDISKFKKGQTVMLKTTGKEVEIESVDLDNNTLEINGLKYTPDMVSEV